ncbi:MAG: hypothetical protein JWQ88_3461 [Rhodoferax sp.]|nr:hypothetical protein [Rhodoferax sp.]
MTEIRLAWSLGGRTDFSGAPLQNGQWVYADAQARKDLAFSADIGNQAFGAGTHWIEQRNAPAFAATHGPRWSPPHCASAGQPSRHAAWLQLRGR